MTNKTALVKHYRHREALERPTFETDSSVISHLQFAEYVNTSLNKVTALLTAYLDATVGEDYAYQLSACYALVHRLELFSKFVSNQCFQLNQKATR